MKTPPPIKYFFAFILLLLLGPQCAPKTTAIQTQFAPSSSQAVERPAGWSLLYYNDFEDGGPEGAIYPHEGHGKGPLIFDADIEGAFYPQYQARMVTQTNGQKGIRFPTIDESPGGYDYSMQHAYVVLRRRFLEQNELRLEWTIFLPQNYSHEKPSYYYDHRYLYRYYIEGANGREIFSMRFINEHEIGFYMHEKLLPQSIHLEARPDPSVPHFITLDIEFKTYGTIAASFDLKTHPHLDFGEEFEKGNVMYLVPTGNALLNDRDLSYFSSIDEVGVYGHLNAEPTPYPELPEAPIPVEGTR